MSSQTTSPSLAQIIQKYNLDISIVDLINLENNIRFDAEFYQGKFLNIKAKILNKGEVLDAQIIHPTEIKRDYTALGMQILMAGNVKDNELDLSSPVFMDRSNSNILKKNRLIRNDVLMTRSGANFGQTSHYIDIPQEIYACADVLIIRNSQVDGLFLSTFFNTKFGVLFRDRGSYGLAQPHIAPNYLKSVPIPIPSSSFQQRIAELVQEAHRQREISKSLYTEAEKVLLDELELSEWKPSKENIAEKMSEEVEFFGRCDAEFFQPKYDEILKKIKSYKGGYDTIEHLVVIAGRQMKIESSKEYQYCELADIDARLGVVERFTQIIGTDLPSRARMKIEKGDVVVSSVAGSSQKVALIESVDDNLVASTGFFVLKPKAFNSETNLVLMKSSFMQMFLERSARGMILSATNQDDFKNLIIPNIVKPVQEIIASKIIASHEARKISKDLLEKAKRAVEIFIEEDEAAAEKWLNA